MTNFTPQPTPAQELRDLLGAIHTTPAVDPPASAAADDAYRRAYAHRAVLVQVAVGNFLRDPAAYPAAPNAPASRALRASTRIG